MTRAGLLMREVCEYLNIDIQPCDLGVILIDKDEQQWRIAATAIDQRLIICSELARLDTVGHDSGHYLRMNADLKLMRGAWVGVGLDDVVRLYYQESLHGLIASQVVSILQRLMNLRRYLMAGNINESYL